MFPAELFPDASYPRRTILSSEVALSPPGHMIKELNQIIAFIDVSLNTFCKLCMVHYLNGKRNYFLLNCSKIDNKDHNDEIEAAEHLFQYK